MIIRSVHIARNGKIIGQYPPEQIAALMDSGHFFESDLCSSEAFPEWTPLPEFLKKINLPKYSRLKASDSAAPERHSSRGDRRSRRPRPSALIGWIAFLLALAALVGAGFWIAGLYSDLAAQELRVQELVKQLAAKEKEYQRMLFVSREVAEPGIVRGSLVLRNDAGKRIAMPGVRISLFPRKVVAEHLEQRSAQVAQLPAGSNVDGTEFFLSGMPAPIASTTTDASGRYEFRIPEPGEYVVSASLASGNAGGRGNRLWFVSFDSSDALNTPVDITETNGVQQFIPSLMIVEGR
jgi:hypothetical protein